MKLTARLLGAALVCAATFAPSSSAQVAVPPLFGDHMVAQCERPFRVWGEAPPETRVLVTLSHSPGGRSEAFHQETEADADGAWQVEIAAQPAGGPYRLTVGTATQKGLTFDDVWFGEVWVCSGQSNMEWPLKRSAEAERYAAEADVPGVRLYKVPRRASAAPESSLEGGWVLCSPETVPDFSAVGYHFGRAIEGPVGRPIGLIQSAWGGTPAESWTERSFLEGDEDFAAILEREPRNEAWAPSGLFNGMIAPLARLELAGAIWYQGESNAGRAEQYRTLFPAMIRSWRAAFAREDLPFLFVQLANFKARAEEPGDSDWAELREAQSMTLALARTAMAVIIDVGEANDIHPRDKRTVGERLGLCARALVYGEDVEHRGPTFRSQAAGAGGLRVEFDHAEGLETTDGRAPAGFAVAGEDRVFHWAEAAIDGQAVVLTCAAVPAPVAVRFGWADNPDHNLVNGAGLPAVPFRSDDWPGVTAGQR